jgi:CRISPR-associated endonuclease/helicase Cas3
LGLDFGLWGKSDGLPPGVVYPLVWHLLDAAAVAWWAWDVHLTEPHRRTFVQGLGLDPDTAEDRERARRLLACWAGWHDLGKITVDFQMKDAGAYGRLAGYPERGEGDPRVSHGWATHLALIGALPAAGYDAAGGGLPVVSPARRVAQLLGGHHGRFFAQPSRRELRHPVIRAKSLGDGRWEEQREAHFEVVAAVTGQPPAPMEVSVTAVVLAAEVVVLSDWLASQIGFVKGQLGAAKADAEPNVRGHWSRAMTAAPGLFMDAGLGVPEWEVTPLT